MINGRYSLNVIRGHLIRCITGLFLSVMHFHQSKMTNGLHKTYVSFDDESVTVGSMVNTAIAQTGHDYAQNKTVCV